MFWHAAATTILIAFIWFVVSWGTTLASARIALRKLARFDRASWVERARHAYSARVAVGVNGPFAVTGLMAFLVAYANSIFGSLQAAIPAFLLGSAGGIWGVSIVSQRLERRLCQTGANARGMPLRTIFVLAGLFPIIVTLGLLPVSLGTYGLASLVVGTSMVTLNVLGAWMSVLGWLNLVRPASARVVGLVARAAHGTKVRYRAVLELDSLNANALALPMRRTLVFTRPLVDLLDDDELAAVAAHELGHLDEPWPVRLARILVGYLPVVVISSAPFAVTINPWMAVVAPGILIAAVSVLRRLARKMEVRSDRLACAQQSGTDGVYAGALAKIYEANLVPAVLRGRPPHPNLYDRLVAVGATPAFDRPAPPPNDLLPRVPTIIVIVVLACVIAVSPTLRGSLAAFDPTDSGLLVVPADVHKNP